jgi:hypothetical protein
MRAQPLLARDELGDRQPLPPGVVSVNVPFALLRVAGDDELSR